MTIVISGELIEGCKALLVVKGIVGEVTFNNKKQQILQKVVSMPIVEAAYVLTELHSIGFLTRDEVAEGYQKGIDLILNSNCESTNTTQQQTEQNTVEGNITVLNPQTDMIEPLAFDELNFQDLLYSKNEKEVENIAWVTNALIALRDTLQNVDYKKTWKAIKDIGKSLENIVDLLLLVKELLPLPLATKTLCIVKSGLREINGTLSKPETEKITTALMERVTNTLLTILSQTLSSLGNNPDELIKLNQTLGLYIEKVKSSITEDVAKAVIGTGATFAIGAPLALGALGFGSQGIVAGSVAASMMGPAVASGSLFAFLQSAGVVGLSFAATGGMGVLVGLLGFGIYKAITSSPKNKQLLISN